MLEEIFGYDILLSDGNFVAAPNGDLETISGLECFIQEIKHEMMTYPGDLFYDPEYGFGLLDFIHKKSTDINKLELKQRIKTKLSTYEQINRDTIKIKIAQWKQDIINITITFKAYETKIILNLSITDRVNIEVIQNGY
jgi:hypothetical protein